MTATEGKGGCLVWMFFLVFALAGAAMFVMLAGLPIVTLLTAQGWEEHTCTVTSSRVASSSSGDTYSVEIKYSFLYNDRSYTGQRYDFSFGSSSGRERKARVVQRYPVGSEVVCWVDPDNPEQSVLNRAPGWYLLWGLFPLPFMLVGFGGIFFLARAPKQKRRAKSDQVRHLEARLFGSARDRQSSDISARGAAGGQSSTVSPTLSASGMVSGPAPDRLGHLELKPAVGRRGRVIGIGLFALLWNGFVAFFILQSGVFDSQKGNPDWFLAIFLVPFVLVGVGMVALLFHQILALGNPLPHLRLPIGRPYPGMTTLMEWRLSGAINRLRRFSIRLEGREAATYRRGTNQVTDHHVFYEHEVLSMDNPGVDRGSVSLEIPADLMPSFEAPNNKIEWRILVRGEIPMWPDVAEDFPLPVYPPDNTPSRGGFGS